MMSEPSSVVSTPAWPPTWDASATWLRIGVDGIDGVSDIVSDGGKREERVATEGGNSFAFSWQCSYQVSSHVALYCVRSEYKVVGQRNPNSVTNITGKLHRFLATLEIIQCGYVLQMQKKPSSTRIRHRTHERRPSSRRGRPSWKRWWSSSNPRRASSRRSWTSSRGSWTSH